MTNKIILRDNTDKQFDDLIIFNKDVKYDDIKAQIQKVKEEVADYTSTDIYKALRGLSSFTVIDIGQLMIFEY